MGGEIQQKLEHFLEQILSKDQLEKLNRRQCERYYEKKEAKLRQWKKVTEKPTPPQAEQGSKPSLVKRIKSLWKNIKNRRDRTSLTTIGVVKGLMQCSPQSYLLQLKCHQHPWQDICILHLCCSLIYNVCFSYLF